MSATKAAEKKNIGARLSEYLGSQGYEVTEQVKIKGRSGLEHNFDVLARRDDGFARRTIAFAVLTGLGDQSAAEASIFAFANKTYDAGISERAVILPTDLAKKVQEFADSQKVQVFDEASLEVLFSQAEDTAPEMPVLDRPLKFNDKAELIETLKKTGYRVEEHSRLAGKSGIDHTFDLVASANGNGAQEHLLGIDIINHATVLSLEEIALFDTKAYDARVGSKFIATSSTLSEEAAKFADSQKIRIIEFAPRTEPAPEPLKTVPVTAPPPADGDQAGRRRQAWP